MPGSSGSSEHMLGQSTTVGDQQCTGLAPCAWLLRALGMWFCALYSRRLVHLSLKLPTRSSPLPRTGSHQTHLLIHISVSGPQQHGTRVHSAGFPELVQGGRSMGCHLMTISVNEPMMKADSAMDRNMKNVAQIVSGMLRAVKSP